MVLVTHGVVRCTGSDVSIDGISTQIAYVMPPREITIEGADTVTGQDGIEFCSIEELQGIVAWLDVDTASKTKAGLIKAIRKHVTAVAEADWQ